jgi:uncharacterized membrane protein
MKQESPSALDRITFQDWALAVIGGLFTGGGLLMLRSDFKTGLVTLVFFGLCFVHAVSVILRKRRARQQVAMTASVTGGVPIRQSRLRMGLLGGALLGLGLLQVAFIDDVVQVGIGGFLIVVGVVMLAGLASGRLYTAFIQFDPDGLTFGDRRGKAVVPWHAVTGLARTDMSSNPIVLVLVDAEAIDIQPAAHRPRLVKQMARSRGAVGADFAIMSTVYGIDAPVVLAALQRYVTEPSARQELLPVPRLRG